MGLHGVLGQTAPTDASTKAWRRAASMARWTMLWAALWSLCFSGAVQAAPAHTKVKKPEKAAPEAFDPNRQFTILKIQPDAGREEVQLFLSQPLPPLALRPYLRLLPLAKIYWKNSTTSPDGVLTLKGNFRYGVGYVVNIPDGQMVEGKAYVRTVGAFFMPPRPPKVEFVEQKSVIERDSRQLLHVRSRNVKHLLFEGLRVPPMLLPQAMAVEESPKEWDAALGQMTAAAAQLKPLIQGNKEFAPFVA